MTAAVSSTAVSAAQPADGVEWHLAEARRLARLAAVVLMVGLIPVVLWVSLAPLSSAVVAKAFVKVDLDRRPVQHSEGGVVREIKVRDGQRVQRGQPLLVLGDVSVDADMNRLTYRVMSEQASLARLEAEQLSADRIEFPEDVTKGAATDSRIAEQLRKERALFNARHDGLSKQIALLRTQREKVQQEVTAWGSQIAQATESLRFQRDELEINKGLSKEGFISSTRVAQLSAAVEDYGVKQGEKRSEMARAEQKLIDIDMRVASINAEYRQQASDQAKATAARLSEVRQEQRKAIDASSRQVISAPETGDIVNLRFTSAGAVVPARETIADIVPANPRLLIEAHIRPEDVARVTLGQRADIRLTAFPYRTTKLVSGTVVYLGADRSVDRATNAPYFVAHIEPQAESMSHSGPNVRLQPGMPAEVFIEGDQRTPLEYLVEPVTNVLRQAGRER